MRSSGLVKWYALLILAALVGGCSQASIALTAGKSELCAGGYDKTDVTALVKLSGGKAKAGIVVSFSLSGEQGSFSSDPTAAVTSKDVATDATGKAVVTLYAGTEAGVDATITASFTDDESGDSATASLTVQIVTPQPGCGGAPTSRSLNFYCDALNIGALRQPMPDIAVPCHVEAANHDGQAIPAEAMEIQFLLEAGSMEPATGDDGHRYFLYHPSGGTRTAPVAVTPSTDLFEPSRFDANGDTHCPRQGLVTLVAVVRGEESWIDTNGNGQFDPGVDTFDDIAEPFLDVNDNGQRDTQVDIEGGDAISEDYLDTNSNGQYDGPNGKWDADTNIWVITHILWTGAPVIEQKTGEDNIATHYTLSANSATITAGDTLDLSLYLRDANMNPVAGYDGQGSSDYVAFDSPEGVVTLNPSQRAITQQIGFTINSDGSIEGNSFFKSESPYRATISSTVGYTGNYTVTFTLVASPGPSGVGTYIDQITELLDLTLSGKVQ